MKQRPITTHSYIRDLSTNEVIDFEKFGIVYPVNKGL